jgi:hypothetical protein
MIPDRLIGSNKALSRELILLKKENTANLERGSKKRRNPYTVVLNSVKIS